MLHGIRYITTKNAGDWWKKKLLRDIMIEGSTELHIPPTVAPDGQTGRERWPLSWMISKDKPCSDCCCCSSQHYHIDPSVTVGNFNFFCDHFCPFICIFLLPSLPFYTSQEKKNHGVLNPRYHMHLFAKAPCKTHLLPLCPRHAEREEWLKKENENEIDMKRDKKNARWYLCGKTWRCSCAPAFFCSGVLHNPYGAPPFLVYIHIFCGLSKHEVNPDMWNSALFDHADVGYHLPPAKRRSENDKQESGSGIQWSRFLKSSHLIILLFGPLRWQVKALHHQS